MHGLTPPPGPVTLVVGGQEFPATVVPLTLDVLNYHAGHIAEHPLCKDVRIWADPWKGYPRYFLEATYLPGMEAYDEHLLMGRIAQEAGLLAEQYTLSVGEDLSLVVCCSWRKPPRVGAE